MLTTLKAVQQYSACQVVRDLVKVRGHYLLLGYPPDYPVVVDLRQRRDEYIHQVGLAHYLSQMLGPIATVPLCNCVLGWEDGRVMEFDQNMQSPVQKFIRHCFSNDLPCVIEVTLNGRLEARFL